MNVIQLPVVKRRGRKVTTGPRAEVHVLYAPVVPKEEMSLERRLVLMGERKRAEWAEILSRPYVIAFPVARAATDRMGAA